MKKLLLATALLGLAACATQTPVQQLSGDVLTVSRQAATGFGLSGQAETRLAAMDDARTYCATRSETFELVELVENQPPFILGNFPRAEVRFRCVA
jgi:uncharacterized lipoprotein YmbA